MFLRVIDPGTLEILNILSLYESVIWRTTYNTDESEFQINCGIEYFDILKTGLYIENSEDNFHIGVITSIETTSSNTAESLIVKGVMLESYLLSSRIGKGAYVFLDIYPTYMIEVLVSDAFLDTVELGRTLHTIKRFVMPPDEDFPDMEKVNFRENYPVLKDAIYSLAASANIGLRAYIDWDVLGIVFECYHGKDLTDTSEEGNVVFSRERGTCTSIRYTKDVQNNYNHILGYGEDLVAVEYERERLPGEPLRETSIDLSGEIPWMTVSIENPSGDGGRYYRYIKANPPGYISNRDIWEKYDVERIDKDVPLMEPAWAGATFAIPDIVGFLGDNPEVFPGMELDLETSTPNRNTGRGTPVSSKNRILVTNDIKTKNGTTTKKTIGVMKKKKESKNYRQNSSIVQNEEADFTYREGSIKPLAHEPNLIKVRSSEKKDKAKRVDSAKGKNKRGKLMEDHSGREVHINALIVDDRHGRNLSYEGREALFNSATKPVTTYETRDFLEYVYVNPGESPSDASVIIQGSVGSGDVMYYENFEDKRVEETQYRAALSSKVKDYLKTFVESELVEAEIYPYSNVNFKNDYNVGDIVTCKDTINDFALDLSISAAEESWDSQGYRVSLSLGYNVPSLTNRIKLLNRGGA